MLAFLNVISDEKIKSKLEKIYKQYHRDLFLTAYAILKDYHVLRMDESKEMAKKLSKIYPPYADILTLRYYHQLSVSEIAETLDISENNVSVRLHRALKALKTCIEEGDALREQTI